MLRPDKATLKARARALAETREVELAVRGFELLEFTVAGQSFAFDGGLAENAFRFQESMLTPLPGCGPQIAGIVSRRGALLPIVRMHVLLQKEPARTLDTSVIVVSLGTAEFGLLVETMEGVRSKAELQPVEGAAPWVQGITRDGTTILSLPRLLTDEKLGFSGAEEEPRRSLTRTTETVQVPVRKLESLTAQTDELLSVKLAAQQRSVDLRGLLDDFENWDREWSRIQPDFTRLKRGQEGSAERLRTFLTFSRQFCLEMRLNLTEVSRAADVDRRRSMALVDTTQELSKKLLMYPFSTIAPGIEGAEVEIDRRILDELHGLTLLKVQAQPGNRVQVDVKLKEADPELRERIRRLGGTVTGEGESVSLILPQTLATFRGILVRAAGRMLVFPTVNVERVLRVKPGDVTMAENTRTVRAEGRVVPLTTLAEVLGIPGAEPRSGTLLTLVVEAGQRRLALVVDEIVSEQELLVRELRRPLSLIPSLSGVSVLGTGDLAPILKAEFLVHASGAPVESPRTLLLVDPQMASRTLLKNVLESAGYRVVTASSAKDARTKSGPFDLVVSTIKLETRFPFLLVESRDDLLSTVARALRPQSHGIED